MSTPTIRIPVRKDYSDENNQESSSEGYFTPPSTPYNTPSALHHQIIVQGHYLGCTDRCHGCHRCLKTKK